MALFSSGKRIVLFVREIDSTVHVIGKPHFVDASCKKLTRKVGKTTVTYLVNISKPSLHWKNKWYYTIDIIKGQIWFNVPNPEGMFSPEFIDTMIVKSTVRNLVAQIEKPQILGFLLYIFMGFACGVPLGYIIGNFLPIA